ncbi:MAG: SDR family NAD(P)-dependent oxidoreductase [Sphingobacteriales bacterium]|jgi:3-hydroxy acid dehydrogenase/malonic semialdehyde reductase|nr:SDR family NAD(P)-dependent oxidoreductase [Sphingobacteriales bacterium]MBK7526978.1 SDR family NAD(P)-dependent oxidoreductase [Sphingobacteriales bacterium]MDA0198361.1 SDR family NAD(P)-dependent oxidoreductase [Bacteroidota bacterium]
MIALITGATSGIGKATAQLFAQHGWHLIITGRRTNKLVELQKIIETDYKVPVIPLNFDVRDREQTEAVLQKLPLEWRSIDVLVNNAGLAAGRSLIHEADIADWEVMIDTNLKGLLYISHTVGKWMAERFKGHIVNIGSTAGHEVYEQGNVYCATKFAVTALSKAMRIDLLKFGVKVTNISPGAAETEFSLVRYKGDTEKAKQVYAGYQPLKANDVAEAIYFAVTRPPHVNISEITLTSTAQAGPHYLKKASPKNN